MQSTCLACPALQGTLVYCLRTSGHHGQHVQCWSCHRKTAERVPEPSDEAAVLRTAGCFCVFGTLQTTQELGCRRVGAWPRTVGRSQYEWRVLVCMLTMPHSGQLCPGAYASTLIKIKSFPTLQGFTQGQKVSQGGESDTGPLLHGLGDAEELSLLTPSVPQLRGTGLGEKPPSVWHPVVLRRCTVAPQPPSCLCLKASLSDQRGDRTG